MHYHSTPPPPPDSGPNACPHAHPYPFPLFAGGKNSTFMFPPLHLCSHDEPLVSAAWWCVLCGQAQVAPWEAVLAPTLGVVFTVTVPMVSLQGGKPVAESVPKRSRSAPATPVVPSNCSVLCFI